jgi:hypothetical protein
MTGSQRAASAATAAKIAVAGMFIAGCAVATAGHAVADPPVPYLPPVEPTPGAPPPPGQPVADAADAPAAPPAPPPVGAPPVPEVQNPVYGQGQTPGNFGYLRDLWHTFHNGNPMENLTAPLPEGGVAPPPGAGPPPPLPPGYQSINAPGSEAPAVAPPPPGTEGGGPPLPPGYYPLTGPPPPGYFDPPQPAIVPIPNP